MIEYTRTTLCAITIAVAAFTTPQVARAGEPVGGHADLCVVGTFYRNAAWRRISQISIMDSNGVNADGPGFYGYVQGMHEAAFEDETYECWAAGMISGAFTPSVNPVFTTSVTPPVNINSPLISGVAEPYRGLGSMNGAQLSIHAGTSVGGSAAAGLRSVPLNSAPPWFVWNSLKMKFHYTTFRDTAPGNGSLELLLRDGVNPAVVGPRHPTNNGSSDAVIDAAIITSPLDFSENPNARLRLMTSDITGQAAWNYIIPEVTTRRTGFHFSQMWIKSGGEATQAAEAIRNATQEHKDKVFERLATVQDESIPKVIVHMVVGGNDWQRGTSAREVIDAINEIRIECETAWQNNGHPLETIVFLIVGYHARTNDVNFGFRNELRDYAIAHERVAFYDPAAEFSVEDMLARGYSDNYETGSDPHMSDRGYRALSRRMIQVVRGAGQESPYDLNGDGVVDTADIGIVIRSFGAPHDFADLNTNGTVDAPDLGRILAAYGVTGCPEGS